MTSLKSFCNYLFNKWAVFIVLFSSHDAFFKPVNTVYKINFKICKFFVILIIFLLLRKSEVNLYLFLCQVLKRHSFSMNFLVLYWWVVLIIYLFEKEQNILINCSGAPLLWKYGYLSMRENLVMTSPYIRKKEHSVLNNRLHNNTNNN